MSELTIEEQQLIEYEVKFQEKYGKSASISEISEFSGFSKKRVRELRESISRKGYGAEKKKGNKKTLLLFSSALGVIGAVTGGAMAIGSLKRTPKPEKAEQPIIQPSFAPPPPRSTNERVVVVPERDRQIFVERRDIRNYRDIGASPYYPNYPQNYSQDKCTELGWEWKDGVCHPPDSGDTMLGVGDEWCQQQLRAIESGDKAALGIVNYVNQVCVVNGNYYNYSILADAVCLGCRTQGKECDRANMKCKDNGLDLGLQTNEERERKAELCRRTKGHWDKILGCLCSKSAYWNDVRGCIQRDSGTSSQEDKGLCEDTGGTWNFMYCICPPNKKWRVGSGCLTNEETAETPVYTEDCTTIKNRVSCESTGGCYWLDGFCRKGSATGGRNRLLERCKALGFDSLDFLGINCVKASVSKEWCDDKGGTFSGFPTLNGTCRKKVG